ncbi:MAG: hypothetical protein PHY28_09720 [Dehalococcoidales bacterium]|nr:hypothetical protein [Dehalococcoidales bacterium]
MKQMKLKLGIALVLVVLLLIGACKSTLRSTESQISTITSPRAVTTQCEAVRIAKNTLPQELAAHLGAALCDIDHGRDPHGIWFVEFMVDEITREDLGWQSGENVEFGPGNTYNLLEVDIDALTGEVTSKKATNGMLLGGPSQWVNCDSTMQNPQPIEVVSVLDTYQPGQPISPAGPTIEITLKNVSYWTVVSLNVTLKEGGSRSFSFDFNVTPSNPLLLGESISAKQTLIGGGFGGGIPYSVVISGTLESGAKFVYTYANSYSQ